MVNNNFWREAKRKLIHSGGLLTILPLFLVPENMRAPLYGTFVIAALLLHWYWDRRSLREKYLNKIISDLPEQHKHDILKGASQIKKFEEEVLFGFVKDVKRKKEKEPLLATFYYLLSTFLALVILGLPYAIFGLFAIGVGDCFATVIGKLFGRHKIGWNPDKSWEGWLGFFITTAVSIFALLQFMPEFAVFNPLWLAVIAGFAGATIETIPTVNDNTTIPFGVGLVIWLVALII